MKTIKECQAVKTIKHHHQHTRNVHNTQSYVGKQFINLPQPRRLQKRLASHQTIDLSAWHDESSCAFLPQHVLISVERGKNYKDAIMSNFSYASPFKMLHLI